MHPIEFPNAAEVSASAGRQRYSSPVRRVRDIFGWSDSASTHSLHITLVASKTHSDEIYWKDVKNAWQKSEVRRNALKDTNVKNSAQFRSFLVSCNSVDQSLRTYPFSDNGVLKNDM